MGLGEADWEAEWGVGMDTVEPERDMEGGVASAIRMSSTLSHTIRSKSTQQDLFGWLVGVSHWDNRWDTRGDTRGDTRSTRKRPREKGTSLGRGQVVWAFSRQTRES